MFRRTCLSGGRPIVARAGALVAAPVAVLAVLAAALGAGTGAAIAHPLRAYAAAAAPGGNRLAVPGCTAFAGARALGTAIDVGSVTVRACGPRPSFTTARNALQTVFPYPGSIARYPGYQCVELASRYLAAAYGVRTGTGVVNGAQEAENYAQRYPSLFVTRRNGAVGHPPVRGDVISFADNAGFHGTGHAGVVLSSSIGPKGNGYVVDMEQNYGGRGGATGRHVLRMQNWRLTWKQFPHAMWLHARANTATS